jgi:hypothetical protein
MKRSALEKFSIGDLVQRYESAAIQYGAASANSDLKATNRQHSIISDIYRELRQRGVEAQSSLLPLLEHNDVAVRQWAAAHTLEFAPAKGEPILESIASGPPGMDRFSAEMTLEQWRKGALKFP